ncbi:hypothetical protein [Caudoviricetes sp.]|nr:hypothetical protein [Caudoviricetes sp.]UOF82781.1 hypothetical protein [Caudoviricetes sp.]
MTDEKDKLYSTLQQIEFHARAALAQHAEVVHSRHAVGAQPSSSGAAWCVDVHDNRARLTVSESGGNGEQSFSINDPDDDPKLAHYYARMLRLAIERIVGAPAPASAHEIGWRVRGLENALAVACDDHAALLRRVENLESADRNQIRLDTANYKWINELHRKVETMGKRECECANPVRVCTVHAPSASTTASAHGTLTLERQSADRAQDSREGVDLARDTKVWNLGEYLDALLGFDPHTPPSSEKAGTAASREHERSAPPASGPQCDVPTHGAGAAAPASPASGESAVDQFLDSRCSHDNEDLRAAARTELASLRAEVERLRGAGSVDASAVIQTVMDWYESHEDTPALHERIRTALAAQAGKGKA